MKQPFARYSCLFANFLVAAILLLSVPGIPLKAQSLNFSHYGVEDGLAQTVILSVYQDARGYMWFGTQSGLSRFNGYEFVNYYTSQRDTLTLTNNWIYDINGDERGNIYLATKSGVDRYNRQTDHFEHLKIPALDTLINGQFIYGIARRGNHLYIHTPPALTLLNLKTDSTTTFVDQSPVSGIVYDIGFPVLPGRDSLVWMGTAQGLSVFDMTTRLFTSIPLQDKEMETGFAVTALYQPNTNTLLAGTENGLYLLSLDGDTWHPERVKGLDSDIFIRDIVRHTKEIFYFATEGNGLWRVDFSADYTSASAVRYLSESAAVLHDINYRLFIDQSENLWLGGLAGIHKTDLKDTGIKHFSKTNANPARRLVENIVASVYVDDSGRLWVGNWGKGLDVLNLHENTVARYATEKHGTYQIPEDHVHVIFKDSKGQTWIGTRNGMAIYREADGSFLPAGKVLGIDLEELFSNNRVYSMMEDDQKRLWVGTARGIVRIDLDHGAVQLYRSNAEPPFRLNSNLVYALLQDADGDIWIATSKGVNRLMTDNRMVSYTYGEGKAVSLINDFTISLREDRLGNIWIGSGSGLNRFSKKDSVFLHFSRPDGLPSEIIYDILEDNKGNLWFSTGGGIATIDPAKATETRFKSLEQFKGQEFNLRAVHADSAGYLYFGGIKGLFVFHPDSISKNTFIPPVRITRIQKENDGVVSSIRPDTSNLVLSYRDYAFTLEFAALDYTDPEKNLYKYKMDGLSDKWIELGTRPFVHFTNLPAGNYTFQVMGSNDDGVWNETPTILKVRIRPPWWASIAAYISYVILGLIIVYLIIRIRERTLKREKRILEMKVQSRTAEIKRQKEQAEESELKLRTTVNSLDDLVLVLDENGMFRELYIPQTHKDKMIFPKMDASKHFADVGLPNEVVQHLEQSYETLLHEDRTLQFDQAFSINGNQVWYNTKLSAKRSPAGGFGGVVMVARDITDRKMAEKTLARQKEELDELNSTKDKFFSILAHDLKNPFTNLYSMGDVLVKNYEALDEEDKLEGLRKMHNASKFIYELLENLLTWSRAQQGRMDFNPTGFTVGNVVNLNLNLLEMTAKNKHISLINHVPPDVEVYGDREMVSTVFRNLLHNAVKFSEKGTAVTINSRNEDQMIVFEVADQGKGISPEDQQKLFRLDSKYRSKGTAGETGTGLGLALCYEFVKKHDGKIWCTSTPGEGTVFSFGLPLPKR